MLAAGTMATRRSLHASESATRRPLVDAAQNGYGSQSDSGLTDPSAGADAAAAAAPLAAAAVLSG